MILLPILLPDGFTPTVTVGAQVKMGHILATSIIERQEQEIDVLQAFAIPRRQVRHLLRKNPGDSVSPGDVIASKKGLFGKDLRLVSDAHGTVKRYESDTGKLILIRSDAIPADVSKDATNNTKIRDSEDGTQVAEVHAPLDGVVQSVEENSIVIQTDQPILVAQHGAGGNVQGEIVVLPSAHGRDGYIAEATPHEIDARMTGKVILGGMFDREDLVKCCSIGVLGIIGARVDKEEIHYLLEKRLLLPLVQVDETVWRSIAKAHGKQLFLDADNGTLLIL